MNPRSFTIMDSDSQVTKVIQSSAETVAELKRDLRANGFSVENKTIQEGVTGIEFKTDDAILPHDVPYNGTITNDLVFRLTKAQKHINSGAMSRAEAYAEIKRLGLGDECKKSFGKNFTQCSTSDLIYIIERAVKKGASAPTPAPERKEEKPASTTGESQAPAPAQSCSKADAGKCKATTALMKLTSCLVNSGNLSLADGKAVAEIAGAELPTPQGSIYSKAELDNMFRGMGK